MRVAILGHLQRGGNPTPEDRMLASQAGDAAVRAILDGQTGVMAGVMGGRTKLTPFQETYAEHRAIPPELLNLLEVLAS
jgi:6-phosphofructokinase 1